MERKLATIQYLEDVRPVPNSDFIEQAKVMGWNLVVKKDEFESKAEANDKFLKHPLCVFFEIDSCLPDGPEWSEFMRERKFRVKTCRFRGVLSQGLALPTTILNCGEGETFELGQDVTERLGVTKYQPPIPEGSEAVGPFPGFLHKTDEVRLQSHLGLLDEIRGKRLYVTVKMDGKSATYAKHKGKFYVCGRRCEIGNEKPNDYWKMAEKYQLEERLPEGYAVQGEICGPGIHKNRPGLKEKDLFIFNVYDINKGVYLDYVPFMKFCVDYRLPEVPLEAFIYEDFEISLDGFLRLAKGTYDGTKNRREGIVVRPVEEMRSETLAGDRLTFKVLNNEFLLKDEE